MVNRRNLLKLSALGTASFAAPLAYSASKITMAYNTGNPPGSSSPKDLIDNAEDLDYLMTGDGVSHPNRLGVSLKSWKGMEAEHNADQARRETEFDDEQNRRESVFTDFQSDSELAFDTAQTYRAAQFDRFLQSSGYALLGDYAGSPLHITSHNQYFTKDGRPYRLSSFVSLPYVTTGDWPSESDAFVLLGDEVLRQQLGDPALGPEIMAFRNSTLGKSLGSLSLSVTIHALWPAQPGRAINEVIQLSESLGGGTVRIPTWDGMLETTVELSRRVVLKGAGRSATLVRWGQTGPAFRFRPATFAPGPHSIEDLAITNPGVKVEGSIGIEVSDTFGFGIRRISIISLDTDIRLLNRNSWTEGTVIEDVSQYLCTYGLTFARAAAPATATDSFAFTQVRNYSTEPSAGGFCFVLGDDTVSTRPIRIYNSVMHAAVWHKAGAAAVKWGVNTTVNQSVGSLRSEGFDGATDLQPGLNGFTNGLRQFTGEWITNDGGRTTRDQFMKRMDFRAVKFRDLGQSGPGEFQNPGKWFKCVNLTRAKGSISGSLQITAAYGTTGSNTANAEFFFGRGGALRRPAFSATGDAFTGKGGGTPRLLWVRNDTTSDEALYFYRPPYTNLALFTYAYDSYLNGAVGNAEEGIGLQELWTESATPLGAPGTTVLYDTQGSYQTQQMYCGDEMAFSGQRLIMKASGNGFSTQFFFTHDLGVSPEYFTAVALSADAITAGISKIDTTGDTDVRVTFKVAPVIGNANVHIAIEACRKAWTRIGRPAT